MKVLRKKLKKVNKTKKLFYYATTLLYIITLIYFIYGLLKLKGIETLIRAIVIAFFIIWGFIYILSGLLSMLSKKKKSFIFLTIITLILCPVFTISSYYINKVYGEISNVISEKLTYTSNLITLKETNFTNDLTIGMIESENDIEGNILAKKLIKKENLTNKIEIYEDYHSMITDLYRGKIGGCFVSNNYSIIFEGETFEDTEEGQKEEPIKNKVKVIYEYSEERKNQDMVILNQSKTKKLTEPFTVLIMGVDSTIDGLKANQAFNGDTLIMATFNPSTLTATMFSIPRDLYVPIACNHNRYAKINSSAAYGSSCVINTVQQLTDINIDYYVKINFTGVVELIDALGGVTVDVEKPDFQFNNRIDCKGQVCEQNSKRKFGNDIIYVPIGVQKLNGEQALAYARNRHQYAISDIARNQHQQQIIEAAAHELKNINSISEFEGILTTVSRNIETNMTPEQMMSFYSVGKEMLANSSGNSLSIKKTYLSYYSLPVYLPKPGRYTSALGYYPESLDAITNLMKVNLELEKEKPIKTFSISFNENYTTPLVGKGLTGGNKLEKVKSFVGTTEYEANTWCQTVELNCTFETVDDSNIARMIINQSAHEGELVKSINNITFYISNGKGNNTTIETETPNTNNSTPEEENNSSNNVEIIPGTPNIPENNNDNNENNANNNDSNTSDDSDTTTENNPTNKEETTTEPTTPEENKTTPPTNNIVPGNPEEQTQN